MRMTLALAGGTALLGAGIGAATLANAEPTPSPTAPSTSSSASTAPDGRGVDRDHHGPGAKDSTLAKSLAEKLGLEEDVVSEALQAAREANRPEKPADGEKAERPDPAEQRAALAKTLAEKLGVDEAKVTTALTEIDEARQAERTAELKSRLDQAVSDGTLTRAEADAVLKAAEAGLIQAGGGPRR
ncbi:hypothetical protein ACQBAR_11245 [Propionibacteriaceae bacterium Y1685]